MAFIKKIVFGGWCALTAFILILLGMGAHAGYRYHLSPWLKEYPPDYFLYKMLEFDAIGYSVLGSFIVLCVARTIVYILGEAQQRGLRAKRLSRKIGWRLFGFVILLNLWNWFLHSDPYDCDYYTKRLNGGISAKDGGKYDVKLCAVGNSWGHTRIRLQVYSTQNENLLAERFYTIMDIDESIFQMIDRNSSAIEYSSDVNAQENSTIPLPPTWLDWVRARFP